VKFRYFPAFLPITWVALVDGSHIVHMVADWLVYWHIASIGLQWLHISLTWCDSSISLHQVWNSGSLC
jgi:hypothetical protein